MGTNIAPPAALEKHHRTTDFDCGNPVLNQWLTDYAWMNQQAGTSKTFVLCREDHQVIGYYSLAAGAVAPEQAASRITKGLSRHPVPVAIIARLAVDRRWQGYKIGQWLLRDGLIRTVSISGQIGIRAVLVHAKDENARKFYTHHGFEVSPVDPMMLMLLLKDIKKSLAHEPLV